MVLAIEFYGFGDFGSDERKAMVSEGLDLKLVSLLVKGTFPRACKSRSGRSSLVHVVGGVARAIGLHICEVIGECVAVLRKLPFRADRDVPVLLAHDFP